MASPKNTLWLVWNRQESRVCAIKSGNPKIPLYMYSVEYLKACLGAYTEDGYDVVWLGVVDTEDEFRVRITMTSWRVPVT